MKKEPQFSFQLRYHGGSRARSGRKKLIKNEPKHIARETVNPRVPFHINFKLCQMTPCLRSPRFMKRLGKIFANAKRFGLNIQQFTIESNHIHLITEANTNDEVTKGMISLKSSIVWALRKIFMYHGKVFTERYYIHHLKTPTEMRNALKYVLFNHAKHTKTAFFADAYSSIFAFAEASEFVDLRSREQPPWFAEIARQLEKAKTWMQREGWRRGR